MSPYPFSNLLHTCRSIDHSNSPGLCRGQPQIAVSYVFIKLRRLLFHPVNLPCGLWPGLEPFPGEVAFKIEHKCDVRQAIAYREPVDKSNGFRIDFAGGPPGTPWLNP